MNTRIFILDVVSSEAIKATTGPEAVKKAITQDVTHNSIFEKNMTKYKQQIAGRYIHLTFDGKPFILKICNQCTDKSMKDFVNNVLYDENQIYGNIKIDKNNKWNYKQDVIGTYIEGRHFFETQADFYRCLVKLLNDNGINEKCTDPYRYGNNFTIKNN